MNVKYTHIINKEASLLHHNLGYLKELCCYYGIKPIFTHTVCKKENLVKKLVKRELLKKIWKWIGFFLLSKICYCASTKNPCIYEPMNPIECSIMNCVVFKKLLKTTEDMLGKAWSLNKVTTTKS